MVFVASSYSYHVLCLYDFIMNVCKTNSLFVKECFGNKLRFIANYGVYVGCCFHLLGIMHFSVVLVMGFQQVI